MIVRRIRRFPCSVVSITMSVFLGFCCSPVGSFTLAAPPSADVSADESSPVFETDILPLLEAKCADCHNHDERTAGLDLTSLVGVARGGESGAIVTQKQPESSLLYEMIHEGAMPPEEGEPLTKSEIAIIHRWIQSGAKTQSGLSIADATPVSQHDVLPILYLRCSICHGLRRQEAGLDLRSKQSMLKGGESGPAIVPGKPDESLLLTRIHSAEMPPRKKLVDYGIRPVETNELKLLTRWIAQGAPETKLEEDVADSAADHLVSDEDRQFWSFQPPKRSDIPVVRNRDRVRTPVDAFVLRQLEEHRLDLSPEADRLALIRRVAFDLIGLPPAWEDVERFLADSTADAYERMVDRYLASPHYGERWGKYWLDLAGYADSEGKRNADVIRPHAWRYRDYVVRAFNDDKRYDQFLIEQLAGDELVDYEHAPQITPQIIEKLVATGFLRMAPDGTGSDIVNTVVERMEVVADEINVFSSAVLGLTLRCVQCHSHKYDPIPHRDYYRLVAVFRGAYDVHDWLASTSVGNQSKGKVHGARVLRHVLPGEQFEWKLAKAEIDSQVESLNAELDQAREERTEVQLEAQLSRFSSEMQQELRAMLQTPKTRRTDRQKQLASQYGEKLRIDASRLKKIDPEYKKLAKATAAKIAKLQTSIPPHLGIRALWDRGQPSPTCVFRRGEITNPGDLVSAGVPAVLTSNTNRYEVEPPSPDSMKTGRRLALARWAVDPDHPLTARVMVNRIWKHHFGRGIVKSLDDFGATGSRPTHPELLDWLAREFIESGWSVKWLHRLMMTSSTYRQVSTVDEATAAIDPQNRWLARMPLLRMDAEVVRDSILSAAGELDDRPFGQPDPVTVRADGLVTSNRGAYGWRRSIYVQHRRREMPTLLESFDLPQMIPNCVERSESTVASQALYLLNNAMIRQLAELFAKRVMTEVGDEPYLQVERVFQIALGRLPTIEERELSLGTLAQLAAEWAKQLEGNDADATPDETPQRVDGVLSHHHQLGSVPLHRLNPNQTRHMPGFHRKTNDSHGCRESTDVRSSMLQETTRRGFIESVGNALPTAALMTLLGRDLTGNGRLSASEADHNPQSSMPRSFDLKPKSSHFVPRAKAVIQLFMQGGPSQVDLFDPKPALDKFHGQSAFTRLAADVSSPQAAGGLMRSPFRFAQYGECGAWVSELLPETAQHVDKLAIVRSMFNSHPNHEPALFKIQSGRLLPGLPTLGAWVTYGLGSENQNLPAFVVLDDPQARLPTNSVQNWQSGYLPPIYQGTRMRPTGSPVLNLEPEVKQPDEITRLGRDLLSRLDSLHKNQRPGQLQLDARIASYQLAARMQLNAAEALDLSQESKQTLAMYGVDQEPTDNYARRCVMARRLVERGVRFVQLYTRGQSWDNHSNIGASLPAICEQTDQPVAALLHDLEQRGLLDETLVIWGGEFGRLPMAQVRPGSNTRNAGRDHGPAGFTLWMAGGGIRGGTAYGETDEIGYQAVENRVSVADWHATILHSLGLSHQLLAFNRNGLQERLTGVEKPRVVEEIFA